MPQRKINPKILMSNLLYDGPLNNTPSWFLSPNSSLGSVKQSVVPGVMPPGANTNVIFTLPSGIKPFAGAVIIYGEFVAAIAGSGSHIDFRFYDQSGVYYAVPDLYVTILDTATLTSHFWATVPVGSIFSADPNFLPDTGQLAGPPTEPYYIQVQFRIAGTDTCLVSHLDLRYDYMAAIAAVGSP